MPGVGMLLNQVKNLDGFNQKGVPQTRGLRIIPNDRVIKFILGSGQ